MFISKRDRLQKFHRELVQAQRFFHDLAGTITTTKIDPGDPQSMDRAVVAVQRAVDSRRARYRNNPLVEAFADRLKVICRERLQDLPIDELLHSRDDGGAP